MVRIVHAMKCNYTKLKLDIIHKYTLKAEAKKTLNTKIPKSWVLHTNLE